MNAQSIFTPTGHRKYVNRGELQQLLVEASHSDTATHSFVRFLAETGCRISEALALKSSHLDTENQIVVIECLKKRRSGIHRTVPISRGLCSLIDSITDESTDLIWPWSRMTAWRKMRQLFDRCGVDGPHATPRGLRHGFATGAVNAGVPLNVIQRWLGHSDIRTTTIYLMVQGPEEQAFAEQLRQSYLAPARR